MFNSDMGNRNLEQHHNRVQTFTVSTEQTSSKIHHVFGLFTGNFKDPKKKKINKQTKKDFKHIISYL